MVDTKMSNKQQINPEFLGSLLVLLTLCAVLAIFIYALVERSIRTPQEQEFIVEQLQEDAQSDSLKDAIDTIGKLNYVQDTRTGICFATYEHWRLGFLAEVDCEQVPEDMLHTTN
jgi:hypothetical protein